MAVKKVTKDDKKRYLILKDKNIYKGLVILAIPLMLNNFLKTFHDVIDMIFVGRVPGEGTTSVAAIQLTFPVMFTFIALGIGLSVAGTALISQWLGSGMKEDAQRYASQLVLISAIGGVLLCAASFFGAPAIIRSMGVDPSASAADAYVFENSVRYLRIRAFELPVLFTFFSFMAIRQASGDTLTPVLVSGSAIVINIVLSPILITVLGLGVPGAAYATLIAQGVVFPIGLYLLFFAKTGVVVNFAMMKPEAPVIAQLVKIALPASLGQAITAIGFYVMNGIIYSYGPNTVAAFGVGNRIMSMILHPVMAIGGILSAYVGQNIGAQNPQRAKASFRKALNLSLVTMIIGSMFIMIIRIPLAGLFIIDNPDALALAGEYMFYILLGLPLMGVYQAFMGIYNGTGNTHLSFIIAVTRLWGLRVPLVLFMRHFTDLGSSGIWYAMLISNIIIVILGTLLYLRIDFSPKIRVEEPLSPPLDVKTT